MHSVCNICMPQAICDVISSISIGIGIVQLQPIVSGIERQHGIGLTVTLASMQKTNR